jgi:adenylosuccinate synthase
MELNLKPLLDGNAAVVGLQWGDEGKGKIVDVLTADADVVARYNGGANAGHSVEIEGTSYATHLLPVGVLRDGVIGMIGNGVVVDPEQLLKEIDELTAAGRPVGPGNLRISYKAHLVMPWHKAEDAAREEGDGKSIGTTRRGIGPCYADKAQRSTAFRVGDLEDEAGLRERVPQVCEERNVLIEALGGEPVDAKRVLDDLLRQAERVRPLIDDVGRLLIDGMKAGRRIVFEGANATMLDVDHGTYPFVTSSQTSALGVFGGCGVPPNALRNVIGVVKAYTTRVGGGPMPTELHDETGDTIRKTGREYGTTTGRPRRVGWLDTVGLKYAAELSGATALAITLLDVLGCVDELKICTAHEIDGQAVTHFRTDATTLAKATPVYETLPSWTADISTCRHWQDLPKEAKQYVDRVEQLVGVPAKLISVGPGREAILMK